MSRYVIDMERKRKSPEEIPEWVVKVDDYEEFKRLCEVYCGNNEDMIKEMYEARRNMKNRAAAMRSAAMRLREKRQQQQQNPEQQAPTGKIFKIQIKCENLHARLQGFLQK
jgi:hypothetical protein